MEDVLLDNAFSVSQVNSYIKERFSSDENLRALTVKGEVSNFTNHKKTGHFYFTLKDEGASIKAVMFATNASKVPFEVENGMNVIIRGSVQVYERDGVYQLYCVTLEPDGMGALFVAFEQLKAKLAALSLFDEEHKKPIPAFPKKIGVVTAKTGAAIQDIINILSRRYPLATLVLIPALVQGENAPDSIIDGIKKAEAAGDIDVLIVGRGGGSIEDLWAFNSQDVAYAIYDCNIPVISAVGHEIDFTIADFVADLRAPTPSAAAELCSPDIAMLQGRIFELERRVNNGTMQKIKSSYDRLKSDYSRLVSNSPEARVKASFEAIEEKKKRLFAATDFTLQKSTQRVCDAVSTLEALSPLKVLKRGYGITFSNGKPIVRVKGIKSGESIVTRLSDGEITSTVTEIKQTKSK